MRQGWVVPRISRCSTSSHSRTCVRLYTRRINMTTKNINKLGVSVPSFTRQFASSPLRTHNFRLTEPLTARPSPLPRQSQPRNHFPTPRRLIDRSFVLGVIARHCTRLCRPDFEDLALTGVVPLTPDRTFNRIDALCAAGILTPSVAMTLRGSSVSAESGRIGTTWWLLGQSALKDFSGVLRLSGSWGGEAIY